jgi:hypothetical protein
MLHKTHHTTPTRKVRTTTEQAPTTTKTATDTEGHSGHVWITDQVPQDAVG